MNAPNVDLNVAGAAAETRAYTLSILAGMIELAVENMPVGSLPDAARRLRSVHLADTGCDAYRHAAVGAGSVDFAAIPPALGQTQRRVPAVLEITSSTPDADIEQSVERLPAAGWPRTAERGG